MSVLPNIAPSASAVRKAVLLPDHAFFVRVVPVPPGIQPAEIPGQVEMALEGMSPFAIPQLCYGYFCPPGASRVLVYAAYRRRFTVADAEQWTDADAVLPAFAACLGIAPAKPLALLVNGADFVTAIGWDGSDAVPAMVQTRAVAADASPEERAAVQAELAAQLKDFPAPVEITAPTASTSRIGDDDLRFAIGSLTSRFETAQLDALDVRDKDALAARRRDRTRDGYLWLAFLACAAAIALAAVLELGIAGGRLWLKSRALQIAGQAPTVQEIETKHTLANRIEELSVKRLLPLEMITVVGEKLPGTNIQFLRTVTRGLYVLEIDCRTNATTDISTYQAALTRLPACEKVEVGRTRDDKGITAFTLIVTFKPAALRPAVPSS
jgi:hypothetical protein